jgi:hypothetical protein
MRGAGEVLGAALNGIGMWLLSVIATLVLPCLPLFIEWLKDGRIKPETIFVTAAILAATFAFTAEHVILFSAYLLFFLVNLLLDVTTGPSRPVALDHWAGILLAGVAILHAGERFWWHVVLDRSFPERRPWRG